LGAGRVAVIDAQPYRNLLKLATGGRRDGTADLVQFHLEQFQGLGAEIGLFSQEHFVDANRPALDRLRQVIGCSPVPLPCLSRGTGPLARAWIVLAGVAGPTGTPGGCKDRYERQRQAETSDFESPYFGFWISDLFEL